MMFTLSVLLLVLPAVQLAQARCQRFVDAAQTAAANLQANYFSNGGYPKSQWVWISAVDAFYLRQLDALTETSTYSNVIDTVFNGWEDWLNNGQSYDDVQWVSIAYLQAGRVDLAKKYYDIASTAVDSSYCGGGLFWSGARDYKNAITNELYMATSGFMYHKLLDRRYLDNLKNTWAWLKSTRMRGSNGLFNDGLTRKGACNNNGQPQWTYNQGVVLVGLAYLHKYTGDESAIQDAWKIMDAVIEHLTINGGLREGCESTTQMFCNADQQTFKGILTSYMGWFLQVSGRDNNGKYGNFLKQQGDKVLRFAVGPPGWYSNLWYDANGGAAQWTASTQASALGALIAAAQQNC